MTRRYENPINVHAVKVLSDIQKMLESLGSRVDDQQYVLEQAVEMNLWVQMRIHLEGLPPTESLVDHVRDLQQQYLAIMALDTFFQKLRDLRTRPAEKEV